MILWDEMPGNKYALGIHSAMLSNDGYVASKRIKLNQYADSRHVSVRYDRRYLITIIIRKLIAPLANRGITNIKELIDEAWEIYTEKNVDSLANNLN